MKKILQTITLIFLTMQISFAQEAFVESNQVEDFESGLPSCSTGPFPFQYAANDVTIPANKNLKLTTIEPNFWLEVYDEEYTAFIESADIIIYKDENGLPGEQIAIYEEVIPSHTEDLGVHGVYGIFKVVRLTFDIPDITLEGQTESETSYWICVYTHLNYQSEWDLADWQTTTTSFIGNPIAFSVDYGASWQYSTFDGVYNFKGFVYPITVGVASIEDNSLNIYPNPAKDLVNIEFEKKINNIQLINNLGQIVLEKSPNNNVLSIDVSDFENGVYFLRVMNGNHVQIKKLVID